MIPHTVPFVCLAVDDFHGRADLYVNRMHSMLSRHCPFPFVLTCFAGQPRRLNPAIGLRSCQELSVDTAPTHPTNYKIGFFKENIMPEPEFLYLDTTLVIRKDMTSLLEFAFGAPQDLVVVNEWGYAGYNTSVMRIRQGALSTISDAYAQGTRYPQHIDGDQDYIYAHLAAQGLQDRVALFPGEQILSYKRVRRLSEASAAGAEQAQKMLQGATIVKFHGNPKMHHIAKRPRNIFKSLDSTFFKRELYQNWRD